jgi:ferredoxin--NADP+ reductase
LAATTPVTVTDVTHWNDKLFSFRTERDRAFRFETGQFTMIGLMVEGKPLLRAYSIASANYEDFLEFFSIKVPDGPLTSRLCEVKPGDTILLGNKPVGSLLLADLHPGRVLYLFATGTGLAPFLSTIRDPAVYERYEKVVLLHGVRRVSDLAYRDFLTTGLQQDELLGEMAREQFLYYPAVTREPFDTNGRITDLIRTGRVMKDLGLPPIDASQDRAMICGSMDMLKDSCALLDEAGLAISPNQGTIGDYVIERAFVG